MGRDERSRDPADETDRWPPGRRFLLVVAVGVAPWTVLVFDGGVSFVFPWVLVTVPPFGVTTLPDYVFKYTARLPPTLRAWPMSTVLYACALASATASAWWREDRRLTAGLLVLAGLSHLAFTIGLANPSQLTIPTGPLLISLVVWRVYWPDLRAIVSGG